MQEEDSGRKFALVVVAPPPPPEPPAPVAPADGGVQPGLDCGDLAESGAGTYNVRAIDTDCETARQVAAEWETRCVGSTLTNPCAVPSGFECRVDESGYELYRLTCRGEGAIVRFENGA